jgi:hypothetical protein
MTSERWDGARELFGTSKEKEEEKPGKDETK